MVSDATLQQNVIDELAWRPDIDPAHIGVLAANGVVTALDGTVDSWTARDLAEDAAWAAPGVLEVRESLQVSMWNASERVVAVTTRS